MRLLPHLPHLPHLPRRRPELDPCAEAVADLLADIDAWQDLEWIVGEALRLQPDADAFVRICAGGEAPAAIAADSLRLRTGYSLLDRQVRSLRPPAGGEVASLVGEAARLIRFHLLMVDGYADLAFNSTLRRTRSDPQAARDGLGEFGLRLWQLQQRIQGRG